MAATATNKGYHPILERDHPYIFIDSCMQAWPDADYANAHRHGVTAYAVTAWMPHVPFAEAVEGLMQWHLITRKYPNLCVATAAADIRRAKAEGKAALILASQDGTCLDNKLHRVEVFHRLGMRVLIPAYNTTNTLCDGCLDRTDGGLTRFGALVVDECNRLGVLLDCTHVGRRATLEIIERSSQPVVFSHSNPKAMVDNPRNIDDAQIDACVAKGGVIGLAPWGPLVLKAGRTTQPDLDDFMDIVDYVAQRTGGTAHIGIGTDMSLGTYPDHAHDPWGEPEYPDVSTTYGRLITADVRSPRRAVSGFHQYAGVVTFAEKMLARGYSDDDVRGVLGENYLRVFAHVWGG